MAAILGPIVKFASALFGSGKKRNGKNNRIVMVKRDTPKDYVMGGPFKGNIKEQDVQTYQQT